MPETKVRLYKLRITNADNQSETELLPENEAIANYQNRILTEVKITFGMHEGHNWQIELLDEDGDVVQEFILETIFNT